MALEIERKFLVKDRKYVEMAKESHHIRQSYLNRDPRRTVRVRMSGDDRAFLTVKGRNDGCVRNEWEYSIPAADAIEMAESLTGGWDIDKTRYIVYHDGFTWEVDEFHGHLEGLVVAEVELTSASDAPSLPPFVGREVTGDPRYYNSALVRPCRDNA